MSFFGTKQQTRTRTTGWAARLRRRPTLSPIESRIAPAVIVGNVFVDANGNGMRENNEFGQPGVMVYLDLNNNGKFDPPPDPATPGEPATLTGNSGQYALETKLIGKLTVAEIVPAGFKATTPTSGEVTVGGTIQVPGPNFGNQKLASPPPGGGLIRGNVFVDGNGDGVRQNDEPGQGGVLVFIDANGNGMFDPPMPNTPGEPGIHTNLEGRYQIQVGKDGEYSVLEVVPLGFKMTTPPPGKVAVSGGATVDGPTFGNQKLSTPPPVGGLIRGGVFVDLNGDGTRQNTEPGQGGVLVFIDANGNHMFDPPTPNSNGEPATLSNQEGRYEFKVGMNGEYSVLEVVPLGFKMTTPPPGKVMVSGGATVDGPLFGNQKVPNPTPTGGLIRGGVFIDLNGDGARQNNEPGQGGVIVFLDLNRNGKFDHDPASSEPFVTSGPDGKYELKAKDDGNYAVREVVPPGFVMTTPIPGDVAVSGGNAVVGPLFGNKHVTPEPRGRISGRVFLDLNGNMQIDAGEPGLSPVRVYDDVNNDGKHNMGEPSVFSGIGGRYSIVLPAGKHQLREVVPPGLSLTVSPGVIDLMGGQNVVGAHFGNQPVSPRDGTGGQGWEALISYDTPKSIFSFNELDSGNALRDFNAVFVGTA